jgi:hypothetical protein
MKYFLVVVMLLAPLGAEAPTTQQFSTNLLKFHNYYVRFLAKYCGWDFDNPTKDKRNILMCNPNAGYTDFTMYKHARDEAKKVFDLKDK